MPRGRRHSAHASRAARPHHRLEDDAGLGLHGADAQGRQLHVAQQRLAERSAQRSRTCRDPATARAGEGRVQVSEIGATRYGRWAIRAATCDRSSGRRWRAGAEPARY